MHFSQDQQEVLLDVARRAIHTALGQWRDMPTSGDPMVLVRAGCFVSLHNQQNHRLRGCIGHMEADWPLMQAVERMGRAVLEDPRFGEHPVALEELALLEVEISILGPLQLAAHVLDFDPLNHGIQLTIGKHRGCFLPQVARESGWSPEQLLGRLCSEKLGLQKDAWRLEQAKLERFETAVIGPAPVVVPERIM